MQTPLGMDGRGIRAECGAGHAAGTHGRRDPPVYGRRGYVREEGHSGDTHGARDADARRTGRFRVGLGARGPVTMTIAGAGAANAGG